MIYPDLIEQKLGFETVRQSLLSYCHSPLGEQFVHRMKPSFKFSQVKQWLLQVNELKLAIEQGFVPSVNEFFDVNSILKQAEIEGTVLDTESLYQVQQTLSAAIVFIEFINELSIDGYPELKKLIYKTEFPQVLLKRLNEVFDNDGKIKDNASKALKDIRLSYRIEEGRLRSIIQKAFKNAQKEGIVPEGSSISIRDNRMVIPVNASNKRHINGYIHDESATGTIVYIEPVESLEANNKIRELELAERREIHRILSELTLLLWHNIEQAKSSVIFIGVMDFVWAKAKFAILLQANVPKLVGHTFIKLDNARHPQLVLAFAKENRKVIPLSVKLTELNHLLLISGPNAGGKSVALKTVGVNQYMLQCGLLPLVDVDSEMCIFNDLFIDIGDEQSIENDLSTYSSHLRNMRIMLKNADEKSLILIDEFGTGTDPLFGGAIAEAMLEQFVKQKCFGAITTHYSNLKVFAEKTDGIINGAMRFNMQLLEPEYELEVGRPGSSFALELAQKSGVQGDVIKNAKSKLGADQLDIEKLLNKLERQKQQLSERENSLKVKENRVAQLEKKYTQISESIELKKTEIIEKARVEASNLLKTTNREIEKTIRHIKESKAEKKETKKVRASLSSFTEKVEKQYSASAKLPKPLLEEGVIGVGSYALLDKSSSPVEVLEIKGKEAKILAGEFTSYVKLNRLVKVSNKVARTSERKITNAKRSIDIIDKKANYSPVLDIRGKRSEEVMSLLDSFVDDSIMLDQTEVRVLHGKGNGVLREIIRQQLKSYSFVSHFEDEHVERGGAGITVITLA